MKWKYKVITETELCKFVECEEKPITSEYEQEALCKLGELYWELIQILVLNGEKVYYFRQIILPD